MYSKAIEVWPDKWDRWWERGMVNFELGDLADAVQDPHVTRRVIDILCELSREITPDVDILDNWIGE